MNYQFNMLHCVGVVAKRLCAAAEPAVAHKNLVSYVVGLWQYLLLNVGPIKWYVVVNMCGKYAYVTTFTSKYTRVTIAEGNSIHSTLDSKMMPSCAI